MMRSFFRAGTLLGRPGTEMWDISEEWQKKTMKNGGFTGKIYYKWEFYWENPGTYRIFYVSPVFVPFLGSCANLTSKGKSLINGTMMLIIVQSPTESPGHEQFMFPMLRRRR